MTIDPGLCSILIFHKRDWKYFLHHVLCIIFQEKCFSYVLLTDQISLSDCLYFLRYWAICVLQLFVSQVINSEINLIFLIRQFFYVTKKSRQNLNILRTEKAWRTRWRLSTILIASNKSVSTVFWYVKVYINSEFWKFIQYTIHWDKTQTLKKFPSDKTNVSKNFFRGLQLITVLLLIRNSYTSFISLKLCVGFSIFDSVLFLLNFILLFNKKFRPFDF